VLALAIAASTSVFSVVHAVLLRKLPFAHPDRLVLAWEQMPDIGIPFTVVSYPNYLVWQAQSRKIEALANMATINSGFIIGGDEPMDVPGRLVWGNFFDVLGARALRGRTLSPQDDRPGAARVAVVSHGLWQRVFGADSGLVGRTLVVNGTPTTVVGVMASDFSYPRGPSCGCPLCPRSLRRWPTRGWAGRWRSGGWRGVPLRRRRS
jgi:putative ABC transport system permease protein